MCCCSCTDQISLCFVLVLLYSVKGTEAEKWQPMPFNHFVFVFFLIYLFYFIFYSFLSFTWLFFILSKLSVPLFFSDLFSLCIPHIFLSFYLNFILMYFIFLPQCYLFFSKTQNTIAGNIDKYLSKICVCVEGYSKIK